MAEPFPRVYRLFVRGNRTLAILDHRLRIVTEHGEVISCPDWTTLAQVMVAHNLSVYADDFSVAPLPDADDDDRVSWSIRKDGTVIGLSFRARGPKGRLRRYSVFSTRAGWGRSAEPALLADIRAVYRRLGVHAEPTTASGLGIAAMEQGPGRWQGPCAGRLDWATSAVMRDTLVGGRVDTIVVNTAIPELYEYDVNDAYATALGDRFPAGPAVTWTGGGTEPTFGDGQYVTGYLYCRIEIREALTLGPITLPGVDGEPNVTIASPGTYHGWLWAEEVKTARAYRQYGRNPIVVLPLHGALFRAWAKRTTRTGKELPGSPLRPWAQLMHRTRARLKETHPAQAAMIKAATVAGIGRFASSPKVRTLSAVQRGPDDPVVIDPINGRVRFRHTEIRDSATLMPHIASFVQMRVRLQVWRKALPWARSAGLVATNFDAIYVLPIRPPGRSRRGPGAWKVEVLHDVIIPYARALRSAEKVRLPGVPLASRGDVVTVL